MREDAGEISLCGNVREKRAKCGSLPPNAGGLATMRVGFSLTIVVRLSKGPCKKYVTGGRGRGVGQKDDKV